MVEKMSAPKYNQSHQQVLDSILLEMPLVKKGKMFGYPAYYIGGKLFACVYEDAVGLKVPEELALQLLKRDEITHFQPLGKRKMREWIQINRTHSEDYHQDKDIFEASLQHVAKIAKIEITKK